MKYDIAMAHGLGYAAAREDASGVLTATGGHAWRSGFILFAEAFAAAWEAYNTGTRGSMTNARDAYDTWQATGGRTIFRELDARAEERQGVLVREARAWIADCFGDICVADLDDPEVIKGVERHYAGGWAQFTRDNIALLTDMEA